MRCLDDIIWTATVLLTGASLTLIWRLISAKLKIRKKVRELQKQPDELGEYWRKLFNEKED